MKQPLPRLLVFVLVFAGYLCGGRFAFSLLSISGLGAVVFAPAGITLAALALAPMRRWWVIIVAAALAEWTLDVWLGDYRALTLVGFIAANLIEPIVGASILFWFLRSRADLTKTRDLAVFVLAAATGPAVGALIGTAAAMHNASEVGFSPLFFQWWLGDALGVVLVGSAIIAVVSGSPDRRSLFSLQGFALLGAASVAATVAYWSTDLDVGFILLVAIITAGVRFGVKTVSLVTLVVAVIALTSLSGTGELMAGVDNDQALIIIKLQFAAFAIAGLAVAAEAAERDRATRQVALEMRSVADLQQALLPASRLSGQAFSAAGCYRAAGPRMSVGGDWYDVTETAQGHVVLSVGDVVGHGPDAVVAMGQMRFAMAALTAAGLSPGQSLSELDRRAREVPGAMASSAWVGSFDPRKRTLTYAAAGHPPPLLRNDGGSWDWLAQGRSALLGVETNPRPEATIWVSNATIAMFTDGVVERRGEAFDDGLERLREALSRKPDAPPAEIIESVTLSDRYDDAVLVLVRLTADAYAR